MGFSVSGAAALIFAALFVSFGAWFTATADSFERVHEAKEERSDAAVQTRSAQVEITSATYDATADELTVEVENRGATQFVLGDTDLLVDGEYVANWQDNATVAGEGDTRLWLAGETLTITVSMSTQPDSVKVVAAHGVSDTEEVTLL